MEKRVVITGMGCITPVGNNVAETWQNLLGGVSGIDYAKQCDLSTFPSKVIGEVKDFDFDDSLSDERLLQYTSRHHRLGIAAALMAVEDACLDRQEIDPARFGIVVGVAGQYPDFEQLRYYSRFSKNDAWDFHSFAKAARIPLHWVFQRSTQTLSCTMARLFDASGHNMTIQTACASGAHAIGQAYRIVQRGDARIMIAGGADALSSPLEIAAFALLETLSTQRIEPQRASRPFDARRDGFVLGEGAGMLVLEELGSALERKANIYAEIVGFGTSANAYRVTDYPPDGLGPQLAMSRAVADASIRLSDVDYINAHGTSTIQNDVSETTAIKNLFGEYAYSIPVSSIKSCIGHLISGAGAVEAIVSTLAVRHNLIPPTINYEYPDPRCDLDYVPNRMRKRVVRHVLSNSFGFGGQNACLLIKEYSGDEK